MKLLAKLSDVALSKKSVIIIGKVKICPNRISKLRSWFLNFYIHQVNKVRMEINSQKMQSDGDIKLHLKPI